MTIPRKRLIDPDSTGYYHITSRCVRRAFIMGFCNLLGKNFDYRKEWIQDRMEFLLSLFTIDLGGFAIMDNHLHLVLRNRPEVRDQLSSVEIARRALLLSNSNKSKNRSKYPPSELEIQEFIKNRERVEKARKRLGDISDFMKHLKEFIAVSKKYAERA